MKMLSILLIEDDMIETMKFKRVLNSLDLNHEVIEAVNGEQALEILKSQQQLPDLILMDLNMPKMNGIEFLQILKSDADLRYLPAIVLSTSNNHDDIKECYKMGIAGYIMKPLKYEDYIEKIKNLLYYWSSSELISG